MTRLRVVLGGAAVALLTGCGCDAVGYPGVELTLRHADTNASLLLAGSKLYAGFQEGVEPNQLLDSAYFGTSTTYSVCCGGGRYFMVLDKPGFQRFNTSVNVRTKGRCDIPVLQRVVARLKPIT